MTYSATLTRGNVKTILKALKHNNWSVAPVGSRHGYAAKPPSGVGTVRFSQQTPRKQVVEDFESFGLTLQLNGGPPRLTHGPAPESLAPLMDLPAATQKPLIDIPTSVLRTWDFSDHAFNRMNARNIGYFEVMAALHQPDNVVQRTDEGPDVAHYFRGDIEVVADKGRHSVITVLDPVADYRTTPRVALAPEVPQPVIEQPVIDSAPPEETPVAKRKSIDFASAGNKSQAIRDYFKTFSAGAIVSRDDLREAFPGEANTVENNNWLALADLVIGRCYKVGSMRRATMGQYEIVDPEQIDTMVASTRDGAPRRVAPLTGLAKSLAVRRGEIPSTYSMIRAALDKAEPGTIFTSLSVVEDLALDCTTTTASTTLRKLHNEGLLTLLENAAHGTHQYRKPEIATRKPRKAQPSKNAPFLAPAPSTVDAELVHHHEDDPEDAGAVYTAKKPRAKAAPRPRVTFEDNASDGDYEVRVGFAFVPELPKSDVYDLVDIVHQHRADLDAQPWGWAQIATYEGGRAAETASKRAAKLEADLKDPNLRFEVRRVSTTEVGLFVARAPNNTRAGARGAHT